MKKGIIIGGVVVLLIIFAFVGMYNSVIRLGEEVNEKWAQVENQLQRRYDLVPDLVKIANKYASHEQEVINAVLEARTKLSGANSVNDEILATNELESAISKLLVVVENYPNLKADATYIALMDEMSGTENRIAVARKDYNEAVKTYNVKIKTFPAMLFKDMLGAEEKVFFEVQSVALDKPEYDI